ncbi:MAG: hypothetical protein ABIL58_24265, partial [Pseudomonadota bacterium]
QTFGPPRVECPAPISNRTAALFSRIDQFFPTLLKHYNFVAAELIIFSIKLKISGMIDLLMQCRKTGDFIILDWKQNKEITMANRWDTALPPIADLDDCDIAKYALQLTTYRHI